MLQPRMSICVAIMLMASTVASAQQPLPVTILDDCESLELSRKTWTFENVPVGLSEQHATSRRSSLKLTFPAGGGVVQLNLPGKQVDWSRYKALAFDLFNAEDQAVELRLRIDDAWSQGFKDRFEPCEQVYLPPKKSTHLQIDLDDLQANNFRLLDTSRIVRVSFHLAKSAGPRDLYVDSFRLLPLPAEELGRIVPDATEPRAIDDGSSVERSRALWKASDARVEPVQGGDVPAALGCRSALRVALPAGKEYPGMRLDAVAQPMDWRGYKSLVFDLLNPGNRKLSLGIRIDDAGAVDRNGRFVVSDVELPPGKKTIAIDIWRMVNLCGRKTDKLTITLLAIYAGAADQERVFYVGNLRLGVEPGGLPNELRPGRIPGETSATLGRKMLDDPEIRPLVPIFKAMGRHKMAICSHSASMSIHWSTSGAFFDVAAEAIRAVNPEVEYKGFHAGGMGAERAVAQFLQPMQEYRPTDTYLLVVPDKGLRAEQQLIDGMAAVGSRVFVFDAVKPWGAYSPAQQEALGKFCKDRGATFIELMARGYGAPRSYKWTTTDTIHMTTEGHLFYAKELLKEWAKIYGPQPAAKDH